MQVAVGAMQVARITPAGGLGLVLVKRLHNDPSVAGTECGLEGLVEPRRVIAAGAQPILDDLQFQRAFPMHAGVALALELGADVGHRHACRNSDRKTHQQPRVACRRGVLSHALGNARRAVAAHRLAALPAMQDGGARIEEFQVVVDLGHRPHGRARGTHRVDLIDGDGWRNALDAGDPRLVAAIEELARVGRKGFDVTPLPLGVQRIEHQRGFAGARHTGDHGQFAVWNFEVEVLEVILAGAADDDGLGGALIHRLILAVVS